MFLLLITSLTSMLVSCRTEVPDEEVVSEEEIAHPIAPVAIIATYDNNPYDERLRTAWGFSCLIRFGEKSILFDTGKLVCIGGRN